MRNDTTFKKRFRVPGFGTDSGALEPVPWNRFLRQITTRDASLLMLKISAKFQLGHPQQRP